MAVSIQNIDCSVIAVTDMQSTVGTAGDTEIADIIGPVGKSISPVCHADSKPLNSIVFWHGVRKQHSFGGCCHPKYSKRHVQYCRAFVCQSPETVIQTIVRIPVVVACPAVERRTEQYRSFCYSLPDAEQFRQFNMPPGGVSSSPAI